MAETKERARPIESHAQLVEHFEKGNKPDPNTWRIGTEHEKFGFHVRDHSPVAYEGPFGIRQLLTGLAEKYGYERIMEGETIIGLKKDGASISLEPGGQFELSGAPLEHLHQTCSEVGVHLAQLRDVAGNLGIAFLGLGVSPKWSLEETPIMPKGRYKIMRDYMPKVGRLGRQMMFRSCTVQTNLDYGSENDMRKKMRVSLALQPIVTALFANSPFMEGRPNGFLSYRAQIWTDTDPDRTGMLPFAFDEGFGFEQYADYALDVPMYFVYRDGRYIDAAGASFRDFMAGKLAQMPGELPTIDDWSDHLTTLFPEVRLKRFLEMRGADGGRARRIVALPAFWVGLLYDPIALSAAWNLVKDWTAEERQMLRDEAPRLALATPFRKGTLLDVAREAMKICHAGLAARSRRDASDRDEQIHLEFLDETIASGRTPADDLIASYEGPWARDIDRAFEAAAF